MTTRIIQEPDPEQFCEEVNKWANKGYIFRPETFTAGFTELYGVVEKPDMVEGEQPPETKHIMPIVAKDLRELNNDKTTYLRIIAMKEFELKLVVLVNKPDM